MLDTVLLLVYACACIRLTLVGRRVGIWRKANLLPFWSYRATITREGYSLRFQNAELLEQIALNYLLFVPSGCLLCFTWPERYADVGVSRGLLKVVLAAAAFSLCVQLAQLVLRVGLFELDDILDTALGATLGCVLYRLVCCMGRRVWGRVGTDQNRPHHLQRRS